MGETGQGTGQSVRDPYSEFRGEPQDSGVSNHLPGTSISVSRKQ